MIYEYAVYFKLLLLCGYKDDLQQYLDTALLMENPLSDIVLELSTIGADDKKLLSVLNNYLLDVKDSDIDYDKTVFTLVLSFLKRKYIEDSVSTKDISTLMYQIAIKTDRYSDNPWYTMYVMGDLFSEAEDGYIDKNDYQRRFDAFLTDGVCLDYPVAVRKESFFQKLIRRICGKVLTNKSLRDK